MTISEEEYKCVLNGYITMYDILRKKNTELELTIEGLRELRNSDELLLTERNRTIFSLRGQVNDLNNHIKFLTHGKEPTSSKQ